MGQEIAFRQLFLGGYNYRQMIYSPQEKLSQRELDNLMFERLRSVITRLYENVPVYRSKFDKAGVSPKHLTKLSDISHFPFTTKADLRDWYPLQASAVPVHKLSRIHATAGTTGKPILSAYTAKDLETWAELSARSLVSAGVREGDIVQVALNYGLRSVGLGVHYGAEKIKAVVVPASDVNLKSQIMLLEELKTTVICCAPSFALRIAELMRQMGMYKENFNLRVGVLGGEPWSENMRAEIEDLLHIIAIDIYGLSEMFGPGVACECIESRAGAHIFMDHFLPEIIDPETGEVLPPGEEGELVLTSLTKEAFPLVRYRTRDITQLNPEPCKCGRTFWRMSKIMGRTDDMIFVRGVSLFPSQIESVLLRRPEVEPRYMIEVERKDALDHLTVSAEISSDFFDAKKENIGELERFIEGELLDFLGVQAKVKLLPHGSLPLKDSKTAMVVDKRKI